MAGNGWILIVAVAGAAILLSPGGKEAPVPEAEQPQGPKPLKTSNAVSAQNRQIGNGYGSVTLPRDADGHFYADAQVNGARIRFMVDTGATSVVLTKADARRAGIGAGEYSGRAITAGGEVRLMPVTLDRLAVGQLAQSNVSAMVAEESLPISLLGQSWLSRVGSVTIAGDAMVLR